jgi:hypothetical protein
MSIGRTEAGQLVQNSPRTSTILEESGEPASAAAFEAAKDELIMTAHTQTLQALLRDDTALQQAAATQTAHISFVADPEQPTPHPPMKKRVSLAPPPLGMPRGSLPEDIVRTPYPLHFRKNYTRLSPLRTSMGLEHELILALSIRLVGSYAYQPWRIIHITLPANVDATGTVNMTQTSPGAKEKHFDALDWDDAHLFTLLRSSYRTLAGHYRFFSARSLQAIRLSHSSTCGASCLEEPQPRRPSVGGHTLPKSPRYLGSKGLTYNFSEHELMKYFRDPELGKARYAWVHWAKRIAICPGYLRSPAPDPFADSPAARLAKVLEHRKDKEDGEEDGAGGHVAYGDCSASLEFVESWSGWRIFLALVVVKLLALGAVLCWILLGSRLQPFGSGYRNAGERVAGGAMLGVFVLLAGWTTVAGWLIISWLSG